MENKQIIIGKTQVKPTKELYKKMYNRILRKERIVNILFLFYLFFILIAIISSGRGNILNCTIILLICIAFIFLCKKKDNKIKKIINEPFKNNLISQIEFYDDFFKVDHINEDKIFKKNYEYHDIIKVLDDKEYIYILINGIFEIIDKKDINKDCVNKLSKSITLNGDEHKIGIKLDLVFAITIFSIFIASLFVMISVIIFNIPGFPLAFIENSWIFFLFIPLPIYAIVLGYKNRKYRYKCLKNILVGLFILMLFLFCGTMSIIKKDVVSHEFYNLSQVEKIVNMDFPSDGKISAALYYKENVRKVIMINFKNSYKEDILDIVTKGYWRNSQSQHSLDNKYLTLTKNYDYFCYYNVTCQSFNNFGQRDNIIYMAYNETTNTLFIIDYIYKS